jgi:hypothetical protein
MMMAPVLGQVNWQVHDEAEYRHDSGGEDYMSETLYEVMQDTEALFMRIDNAIRSYCSRP